MTVIAFHLRASVPTLNVLICVRWHRRGRTRDLMSAIRRRWPSFRRCHTDDCFAQNGGHLCWGGAPWWRAENAESRPDSDWHIRCQSRCLIIDVCNRDTDQRSNVFGVEYEKLDTGLCEIG